MPSKSLPTRIIFASTFPIVVFPAFSNLPKTVLDHSTPQNLIQESLIYLPHGDPTNWVVPRRDPTIEILPHEKPCGPFLLLISFGS
ncbi:hypothetical protein V8C35DRAFT_318650 [Trichoderma chlorosporum]